MFSLNLKMPSGTLLVSCVYAFDVKYKFLGSIRSSYRRTHNCFVAFKD